MGLILDLCFVSNSIIGRRALFRAVPTEDWDSFLHLVAGRGASSDEHEERVKLMRRTTTPEDWLATALACQDSDPTEELPQLEAPTLVMHSRDYPRFPADESMKFAPLIPGARFQLLDGADIYGNAAQGLAAIDAFLGNLTQALQPPTQDDVLSTREVEVLRLLAAGRSNQQIADELVISVRTVERHITNLCGKVGAHGNAEATSYAMCHGLA